MMRKCLVGKIAWVLVLVGALNWGLVGAFQLDIVTKLLGSWPLVVRIVFVLVGLAAIVDLMHGVGKCKACCGDAACKGGSCKGGSCSGSSSTPAAK